MKSVSIEKLKELAKYYGGTFVDDPAPGILFDNYGIEATEKDGDNYTGFTFWGHSKNQAKVIDLWNELTQDVESVEYLTPELARQMIGDDVTLAYKSSGYEEVMPVKIQGVELQKSNQIGQSENAVLVFEFEGKPNQKWLYEWQGIFCCTGSAHMVYIKKMQS